MQRNPFLIFWLQSRSILILGPKEIKSAHSFYFSLIYMPWSGGTGCHECWVFFCEYVFECWILSKLFSSPRLMNWSLVVCFLLLGWCHLHICGCWYFSQQFLFHLGVYAVQHIKWPFLHKSSISRVTMYTLSCSFPNFKSFSCPVSDSNCQFLTYIQTFRRQVRLSATPIILKISLRLLWSTQWKALA